LLQTEAKLLEGIMKNFNSLKIKPEILEAIKLYGFEDPTDIQREAIPFLLKDKKDFFGQAQTGTGKTAAFAIPLLNEIDEDHCIVQSIILAPTRELAIQVEGEIKRFSKFTRIQSFCVYGGVEYEPQLRGIKKVKPQIIVGTPGRVIDLIKKSIISLKDAKTFVLDEADEMLKMGFYEDVIDLLALFTEKPRMIMFSATMPNSINTLIQKIFSSPRIISIKEKTTSSELIDQSFYLVREKHLKEALARLIDFQDESYSIVFCRTKLETKVVSDDLKKRGHRVELLNGDMGQADRDLSMRNFKSKRSKILVCTDVAARGIDIDNITHVFNYGMPRDNESYIHRIGRTGRAGTSGNAMLLVPHSMLRKVVELEKYTGSRIIKKELPSIPNLIDKLVAREVENAKLIKQAITTKTESFNIDPSFKRLEKEFIDLSRDELMKLMFVWKFNKDIRHYNNLENIEKESLKKSKAPKNKKGQNVRNRKS